MPMSNLNDIFFTPAANQELTYDQVLEDVQRYFAENHASTIAEAGEGNAERATSLLKELMEHYIVKRKYALDGLSTKELCSKLYEDMAGYSFLKKWIYKPGVEEVNINAYNDMMDKGMQVLVGPTTTGASIAVAAVTNTERTFMLTPSASSPDVTADKDNVFQVCFTDTNQGTGAADYIAENMAGAKVAIIYRNDDAYSQGIRDTFVKEAEAKGAFEIVSETTFTLATATDFSVQLTAAKNAGADVVFLPIYYEPASVILSQAKAMSYAPTFFGVDGMDGILTMKNFDTSLAEGVMLLTPFSANSEDAATQSFVKAYTEEFGVEPNQFAADAYDAVYIVKAALEKAGCTGDMTAPEICDAIVGVMTSLSVDGLTGKAMTWNAEGEVSKAPLAAVIENGQYVMK